MVKQIHRPILRIVQGFIGAGKTTYSKWLSEKTGDIRLNADEYCADNFSKKELEANWDKCFSQAISEQYIIAEKLLLSGKSVILDFGFWDRQSREYARALAKRIGAEFQHIYLDTPEGVILERLRKRTGVIAARNLQNFQELKKYFEKPEVDECIISIKEDYK